jgi:phospholipase C
MSFIMIHKLVVGALALLGLCALVSCSSEAEEAQGVRACEGIQGEPPPTDEPEEYDEHFEERQATSCKFDADALTADTIGAKAPVPPADTRVVVVMLENRSFDHWLSGVDGTDFSTSSHNPDPKGTNGETYQAHATDFCLRDTAHEWGAAHLEFDNGLMDGFVAANNPKGGRSLLYYTEEDLPFAHWLARNFAVGNRHFSSLLGPTWPNRLFMLKGTSCGYTQGGLDGSGAITADCGGVGENLFTQLKAAHVDFKLYDESGAASVTIGLKVIRGPLDAPLPWPYSIKDFEKDAQANELPAFSMVGASTGEVYERLPAAGFPQDDDHPVADVRLGQTFLHRVLKALMNNPKTFERTILFITYDENGGFYDHVTPPAACEPTKRDPNVRRDYYFDRYGFRVPLIVVSPYLQRAGYVSNHITDHASILRFVQHWQGLPALSRRDANAWPMLDYFNFTQRLPTPELPAPPVVPSNCQANP